MSPGDLPATWRDRASELRRFGAEPQAITLETVADELDGALREVGGEELSLGQAATESGYSRRRLRELLSAGEIPMAPGGRKGRPRIRRGDLPRRPGRTPTSYDPTQDAAAILERAR